MPIQSIQGTGLYSPLAGKQVSTRGVVTGTLRKGFFIQDPQGLNHDAGSLGLFIYDPGNKPQLGSLVEVFGEVVDFQINDYARPTTQLLADSTHVLEEMGPKIEPVWLTAENVLVAPKQLAEFLNSLEGMLVGIKAGATFTAPSNPFGDYVVLPADAELKRTQHGGVLIDPQWPERWLPGFRVTNYSKAPEVNVGAKLLEPVIGPLNFRVASFQMAVTGPLRVKPAAVIPTVTTLHGDSDHFTVLTLNGFNLDPKVERPKFVKDPRRDIDDDIGDGRFTALGQAIAIDAGSPAIVALQEIQDDDGAEMTENVNAEGTYACLIDAVLRAGGPRYKWLDIPPEVEADGGQPGGNIRNGYLFDPKLVQVVPGTLQRLGVEAEAFDGSRKPLVVRFQVIKSKSELEVINVHLASKRHQHGLFAPKDPAFDPRGALRVQQAELINEHLAQLRGLGVDYYVTGDFNDFEFSETLLAMTGDHSTNLVNEVPEPVRYDYNHRGISQALMHGIVSNSQLDSGTIEYEILHANALLGVKPGRMGEKGSDHAYVVARFGVVTPPR